MRRPPWLGGVGIGGSGGTVAAVAGPAGAAPSGVDAGSGSRGAGRPGDGSAGRSGAAPARRAVSTTSAASEPAARRAAPRATSCLGWVSSAVCTPKRLLLEQLSDERDPAAPADQDDRGESRSAGTPADRNARAIESGRSPPAPAGPDPSNSLRVSRRVVDNPGSDDRDSTAIRIGRQGFLDSPRSRGGAELRPTTYVSGSSGSSCRPTRSPEAAPWRAGTAPRSK